MGSSHSSRRAWKCFSIFKWFNVPGKHRELALSNREHQDVKMSKCNSMLKRFNVPGKRRELALGSRERQKSASQFSSDFMCQAKCCLFPQMPNTRGKQTYIIRFETSSASCPRREVARSVVWYLLYRSCLLANVSYYDRYARTWLWYFIYIILLLCGFHLLVLQKVKIKILQ